MYTVVLTSLCTEIFFIQVVHQSVIPPYTVQNFSCNLKVPASSTWLVYAVSKYLFQIYTKIVRLTTSRMSGPSLQIKRNTFWICERGVRRPQTGAAAHPNKIEPLLLLLPRKPRAAVLLCFWKSICSIITRPTGMQQATPALFVVRPIKAASLVWRLPTSARPYSLESFLSPTIEEAAKNIKHYANAQSN